jgi:hypothetical protein
MSTITTLINSTAVPITRIFDDTQAFLIDPDKNALLQKSGAKIDKVAMSVYPLIDKICPAKIEEAFAVAAMKIKKNMSIASISGIDQPIAMTGTGAIEEALTNLFKIVIGVNFTEADQIKFEQMLETGRMPKEYVNALIKNIDDLQPKVMRTAILLTYQVLRTGRVNWTDPRTGLLAQMNYNYVPRLFPDPLTGVKAWTQSATATGVLDIQEHDDAYYDENGYRPEMIVMRTKTARDLCRQQSTRDAFIANGMASAATLGNAAVSFGGLQRLFAEMMLPMPVIMDAQVEIEPRPGIFQRLNLMNTGEYFFANENMGERIFGKTIEGKGKAGIFVDTNPKDKRDIEDQAIAVGRMVPFFENPKLLAARVVN